MLANRAGPHRPQPPVCDGYYNADRIKPGADREGGVYRQIFIGYDRRHRAETEPYVSAARSNT